MTTPYPKVAILAFLSVGCAGASTFPLSIPPDLSAASKIESAVAWVDLPSKFPPEEALQSSALISIAHGNTSPDGKELSDTRARLYQEICSLEIVSSRYLTLYENRSAWHQTTVGLVDLPYRSVLERFDPAADWGHSLAGYLGGQLLVDRRGSDSLVELQRERMVLKTPWYAIGSPNLDMEKWEQITRAADRTRVGWVVARSQNASVDIDVGYLLFRAFAFSDREATLIAFNSVHRIDTGIFPFESSMVGSNIASTFVKHLERYRKILEAPSLSARPQGSTKHNTVGVSPTGGEVSLTAR